MHDTGNTRCIVRTVRLKLSGAKRLFKGLLLIHQIINGICLISVCNNCLVTQHADRSIDDQTWIFELGRIKCLCADALTILYKHPISAVHAATHNKICGHGIFSV